MSPYSSMDEDTLSQSQSQAAQCKRPQLKRTKPREYLCVEVKVLNSNNVQVEMETSNIIFFLFNAHSYSNKHVMITVIIVDCRENRNR